MDPSICELHVGLKRFVALELVQRVGTTTKHKLVDHVTVAQWRQNVYIGRPVLLTTFIWIKAIQKSQFFKIPIPGVGIQLINILRLVFFLFSVHDGMQTARSYAYDASRSSFLPKMAKPERVDSYTSSSLGTDNTIVGSAVTLFGQLMT